MPERSAASTRPAFSIDVVLLTPLAAALGVLLVRAPEGAIERWAVPWSPASGNESDRSLDEVAMRVARAALPGPSGPLAWLEQAGAFGGPRRHPGDAPVSVAYVAAVPRPAPGGAPAGAPRTGGATPAGAGEDAAWFPARELPALAPRHRAMVAGALEHVSVRLESAPVAFRLLPSAFTLSELQRVYEVIVGHPLHKASFRRALQAASLVEETGGWRSEGRGRPARLFRYVGRRRRARRRRGVRFDAL